MNKLFQPVFIIFFIFFTNSISGQRMPDEMRISNDGKKLIAGNSLYSGFYDHYTIHDVHLNFSQPDFWDDLIDNYSDQEDLPATLTINGVAYDSVGVRFKGATSYSGSNDFKKSFNISLNAYIPNQHISGYNIINLNNCYHDPSFMGEILYEYSFNRHSPAPKGNFAHLYINGVDWGIYANVQQVNRDLIKEWFPNRGGSLWRAKRPEDSTAPHGTRGDSLRSLYYLGPDTNDYVQNYNLKSSGISNPFTKLMEFCKVLDTVSQTHLETVLADYLDIDQTIWFMATENAFVDDDSYVIKGRSDYYVYIDSLTGRLTPIEMDGNDTFDPSTYNYSIFSNVNKPFYPLLFKLINHPQLRQRYLAHMRTIMADEFDTTIVFPRIDDYYSMITPSVQIDPINNYTYTEFLNHKNVLKNFFINRRAYILNHSEIDVTLPQISGTAFFSDTIAWQAPTANQDVHVITHASCIDGINQVNLYYGFDLCGKFSKLLMYDDGLHNDSAASDGIYGASIPGQTGGTRIRFYIEVTSDNTPKTVIYDPPGAEHEVYTYQVKPSLALDTAVVVNEIMAKNTNTASDSLGNFSDWIELYNNDSTSKDISGYYLTDDSDNLIKWKFPQGTVIAGNEFLIIWADDNEDIGSHHTNFKFDADGDKLLFLNPNRELITEITFGSQLSDMSLAKVPNGTGNFIVQAPTFAFNNNIYPQISFQADTSIGCIPLTVNFTNNTTNASQYNWDFGDGNTSTLSSPIHTYTTSGNFTVKLIAGTGLISSSDSIFQYINAMTATPFSFGTDTIFSTGATHILSADPGYIHYLWSNLDTNQSILVDSNGLYCVEVTDQNTCLDSACVAVILNSVGIKSITETSVFTISPNPANESFVIHSKDIDEMTIEVYNSLGQNIVLMSGSDKIIVSTKNWAEGIYHLKIGNFMRTILIKH